MQQNRSWRNGNITTGQYARSIGGGAVTGLLSSFGTGIVGGALLGGGSSMANEFHEQMLAGKDYDIQKICRTGALGSLVGGGSGVLQKLGRNVITLQNPIGQKLPLAPIKDYGIPAGIIGNSYGTLLTNISVFNKGHSEYHYTSKYSSNYAESGWGAWAQPDYPGNDVGEFNSDNESTIICTELYRQGLMTEDIYRADSVFGARTREQNPDIIKGYHYLCDPIVQLMKKSSLATNIVNLIAKPWSYEMAYQVGVRKEGSPTEKIVMLVGIPVCSLVGEIISIDK